MQENVGRILTSRSFSPPWSAASDNWPSLLHLYAYFRNRLSGWSYRDRWSTNANVLGWFIGALRTLVNPPSILAALQLCRYAMLFDSIRLVYSCLFGQEVGTSEKKKKPPHYLITGDKFPIIAGISRSAHAFTNDSITHDRSTEAGERSESIRIRMFTSHVIAFSYHDARFQQSPVKIPSTPRRREHISCTQASIRCPDPSILYHHLAEQTPSVDRSDLREICTRYRQEHLAVWQDPRVFKDGCDRREIRGFIRSSISKQKPSVRGIEHLDLVRLETT